MSTKALTLGDPLLDQEHAELQRLIDVLRQSAPAGALDALDTLKSHAAMHFARGAGDLRPLGSANATCHLAEHAAVLRSLDAARTVPARPPPPPPLLPRPRAGFSP